MTNPKAGTHPKKREKVFEEMARCQKADTKMIPRAPFVRLVKQIAKELNDRGENPHLEQIAPVVRWSKSAVEALQVGSEAHLSGLLHDSNLLAVHANRKTLYVKDLQLARIIRGEVPHEVHNPPVEYGGLRDPENLAYVDGSSSTDEDDEEEYANHENDDED